MRSAAETAVASGYHRRLAYGGRISLMIALLSTLPADQAEVIMLRVVAGLDVNRVAQLMGKHPTTVRVLAHRGLRRLAARLGADARIGGML